MRVPHFLILLLSLAAVASLSSCSRESSVKENVNLQNNHSRVYTFKDPLQDPQAFADSMANTVVSAADTIPDTLTVTINDTIYLLGLLPDTSIVKKIYRIQWVLTKPDGNDTTIIVKDFLKDYPKQQAWAYANPGLYEPKLIAFDGNNATDTAGTATRKAFVRVIDTKPRLVVPKDTLWTRNEGDITFPIFASDSFGTIASVKVDLDASGKTDSAVVWPYERFEDNDSMYLTITNKQAKIDTLGNQKIYVTVTDDDGNETKDSVNLHFNRIPKLKIIYPQDGARHNVNDRFYFYYEGEDIDNPQDLKYFIYAQASKNGQPPQKAFTESDLIAAEFTSTIFEPIDQNGNNIITLISDPSKQLTGRIYWDMYATDGYDIVRMTRISTGENSSRPWNFYIGNVSSEQGTFSGVAKYQGRDIHSGIHIELNNGNKTFEAYTDEKGNYSAKVDMGLYTVTASSDSSREYDSATLKDQFMEAGGNISLDELLLKDTVLPVIRVKNIGELDSREVSQTIYARDMGSRLASVGASIDGNEKSLNCSKSDQDAVFNCPLDFSNVTDGTHTIVYTATDKAGNKATQSQSIVVKATQIDLNVNGEQMYKIGEGGTLKFTATVIGAYPKADYVEWSWNTGKKETTKTAVNDDGVATFTLTYDDIKNIDPTNTYTMTASYKSNGANVSTEVIFGIRGDYPEVYFLQPNYKTSVSINDPIKFKIDAYPGKGATEVTTINWTCENLSSGYSCPTAGTKEATLAFSKIGGNTVKIDIEDNNGATGSASLTIAIISDPPYIDVTTDSKTNEYKINAKVTVHASANDKYGYIDKIAWACDNGSMFDFNKDTTFASHPQKVNDAPITVTLPGSETSNYRCIFKAIDDDGEEGSDTVKFITLLDLPTVRLATQKDTVKINSNQTLRAIATDKLGYIAEYNYACSENLNELKNPDWSPMGGAETVVKMPSSATGIYYCVVQVKDDDGNIAMDTAEYKVIVGMPTVTAIANYSKVTIKDVVELNAAAQDSLGSLVKYEWGCGPASATNIGFTYSNATTPKTNMTMPSTPQNGYQCIIRVTDDDGLTAMDTAFIDIILAPPTIKVTNDSLTVREGYNIALGATASDNNGLPSDPGGISKKEWSCGKPDEIAIRWKTVSSFDTVWKAPSEQQPFYCVARATDNDGNAVMDTIHIGFSADQPQIWVTSELIYINQGDGFELDATVNKVWQGIDWFTWECKEKATGKSLEKSVTRYDYEKNGKSFRIGKDSTYSENNKDMYCIVSAQETSTKATFSDTTEVRLMKYHPIGVISAADTVYLWSGDEAVDGNALYFYTPEWNGKKSQMGDLGNSSLQDFWWKFSNVDNDNYYQGKHDGSIDTLISEFNTAFVRRTTEGSMTIHLDYRDSTSESPTQNFYSRHRAEDVSRTVYFRKAWENLSKDTVIAKSTESSAPAMIVVNDNPVIAYQSGSNAVTVSVFLNGTWNNRGPVTVDATVTAIKLCTNGSDVFIGVLDDSNKFNVYKLAGTSIAKIGGTISNTASAQIICKSSATYPHVVQLKSTDKRIYLYEYNGSAWATNTTFSYFYNKQKNEAKDTTYREVDALFNQNNELVVMGVTTGYTAYYGYYKSDFTQIKYNGFSATDVNGINLISSGNTIYMGFLSRNVNQYGPYVFSGTFESTQINWDKNGLVKQRLHESYIAYHIALAKSGDNLYAIIDDKGRDTLSQVHVFRHDGSKWSLYGENQLPYFKTVFYQKNSYYLRGSKPAIGVDNNGKVYISMLARENAGGSGKNNGPLVMKYVADNWEIH